eukprot:EG_transcript_46595
MTNGPVDAVVVARSPLEVINIALQTEGLSPEVRLQLLERKLALLTPAPSKAEADHLSPQVSFCSSGSTDGKSTNGGPSLSPSVSRELSEGAIAWRGIPQLPSAPATRPRDGPR